MINKNRIHQIFNIIVVVSMFVLACFGIPEIVDNSIYTLDTIITLASFAVLYALIVNLDLHSPALPWTSFARFPIFLAWVLYGLSNALWVAFIGISVATIWQRYKRSQKEDDLLGDISDEQPQQHFAILAIFSNNGISLFSLHLAYNLSNGLTPLIGSNQAYSSISSIVISIIITGIISLGLQFIFEQIHLDKALRQADRYLLPEIIILLGTILLPLLLIQMGVLIFLITLSVIAFLIYRRANITTKMLNLEARIQEMTTLSTLSTTIANNLSLSGTINSTCQELDKLLDATTLYIALYSEDHDIIDYRLVAVDGLKIEDPVDVVDTGLIKYVISNKQAIHQTREDLRRLFKNVYDISALTDEHYMIAPLMVSTKVIGVIGASHKSNPDAFSDHDFELFKAITSQASLAIRNSTLYDRTVRLADNLSIINQSLQDVMFNLDTQDALKVSCQIAGNITLTTKAAIFMIDDNGVMTCRESIGFDDTEFIQTQIYDPDLFTDGTRIINNVENYSDDTALIRSANAGQFKALVQIPLRSGNTVIGTLNVYHDMPYFYEVPELNLLRMLTNQITAALDNAELLQALELYAAEQAQLVYLSRISGETLDLEPIIEAVSQTLASMMSVARVAIGTISPDKNSIRMETYEQSLGITRIELTGDDIPEIEDILNPNASPVLRVFYADSDDLSIGLNRYMQAHGDKTIGLMPMRIDDTMIGLIILGDVIKREFNDNELRLLEMATYQITVQIHNARVHTQTEEQLANRLEQLELIEDISQQISEALELDIIIQNVLEAALQSTQADFASIAMMDTATDDTFDIMWREVVDNKLIPNRLIIQVNDGVISHVRKTGEMIIVPDNHTFEDYVPPLDSDDKFNSSLALPMRTGNSIIGVLNLESIHHNFFTGEHATFLKSLAGHAAISIDNANLLVEREQQINTLTLLRELSLNALSFINSEEIYNAVLTTAIILLNGHTTALYTYNQPLKQTEHLASLRSDNGQMIKTTVTIPQALLEQTFTHGRLQLIEDINTSEFFQDYEHLAEITYQSLIIMPVARRQQIHELLCIGFDEKREFTHDDLNSVDLLAVQVAGHLENAALNETITTSNDRMRAILDSTRDGIILLDRNERIQDANTAASDLTGIPLDEYLFKPLADIAKHTGETSSVDVWQDIVEKYYANPDTVHNEEFVFSNEDNVVTVKMLVTSVIDEARDIVGHLLILRDITEEKNLQQFQTMMQSMVLHDLRGPLTSIVTSMYVAENILELYDGDDFDYLNTSLNKTFKVSLVSAEDMLRQVDTLRDLPMLSQMVVKAQTLPMIDIAESAFNSLSANYTDSNITVDIDIEKDFLVYVDESLIQRVIINLMHNAFKFTPLGGTVLIRLVENQDKPNYVRIQIADTGPGIPDEQRERIFGQYIQIEGQKPRTGGKGTGLGLNFCKLAVEAHDGEIWVEADGPLSGACFSFTIPIINWIDDDIPDTQHLSE